MNATTLAVIISRLWPGMSTWYRKASLGAAMVDVGVGWCAMACPPPGLTPPIRALRRSGPTGHAGVGHPDGELKDVWGKVSAAMIARRYGITAWRFSADAHQAMTA